MEVQLGKAHIMSSEQGYLCEVCFHLCAVIYPSQFKIKVAFATHVFLEYCLLNLMIIWILV